MSKNYYPKAVLRIPDPVVSGGRMNMDGSKKIVWHTTETPSSRFYRSNIYYHIQVRQDPYTGEVMWEQYIPFNLASRALRNDPNTPTQTNRDGDVNINVSIVGYAKDTPNLSGEMLWELADFIVWVEREWGVPAVFPWKFIGSLAYGIYGKVRASLLDWDHANGNVGHQHVPDGNTHWDPGVLPVLKLQDRIATLKLPPVQPGPKKGTMIQMDAITLTKNTTPDDIRKLSAAGRFEGYPQYWIDLLPYPTDPRWERFWTAVFVNSVT
jgi:hypothetical protein